eukprot:2443455-Heterocapsa_arctica.AAC.1
MGNTDNFSPTSPSDGRRWSRTPRPPSGGGTSAATVASVAAFKQPGLYFFAIHRAYHLLGVLKIARAATEPADTS